MRALERVLRILPAVMLMAIAGHSARQDDVAAVIYFWFVYQAVRDARKDITDENGDD